MTAFLFAFSFALFTSPAWAGGPIVTPTTGGAAVWDSPIALHPEGGTCGTFSNAVMVAKIETNISHWSDISGIGLEFDVITGALIADDSDDSGDSSSSIGCSLSKRTVRQQGAGGGDVNGDNYEDFFADSADDPGLEDGLNPVVFDDDGAIVQDLFGAGAQFAVLGFAGPDAFADASLEEIIDGQGFFNCRCQAGNPEGACPGGIVFTEDDLDFTMTHEIGHLIGLDHTQVNQDLADGCDLDVAGDCDDLPNMYPVSEDAADQITPQRDDEVAALTLYGLASLTASGCTVTGTLLDVDGDPLRCADVQAETSDTEDTIAVVSGVFAPASDNDGDGDTAEAGECDEDCGNFTLRGLNPAKTYTITVKPIADDWTANAGSSIGPCGIDVPSGIVEEEIATITAGTCIAGATASLGTITTSSTGGIAVSVSAARSLLAKRSEKPVNALFMLAILGSFFALRHARKSI